MKTHTFTRATLALTLSAAFAITSGCATIDNAEQSMGHAVGSNNGTANAAVSGGVIGCGAGALIGHFLGKSALAGCEIGGATGAIASVEIHKHQLEKARELAAAANATKGVTATVSTKTVQAKDASGQVQPTQALDKLTIDLPVAKVKAHSEEVGHVLDKAAAMADQSDSPETIEVDGSVSQRTWMAARINGDLKSGSTVKVIDADAASPALIISPVPNVGSK